MQIEHLLQQCTVRLTIPGQNGWGTGFFVARGLILTCAQDPQVRGAIADLTSLFTQLQTQHPQVQTRAAALPIIDAEFTQIQPSPTYKLATLRQQLLNPERHAQAIKATLGEIAKHYLEDSLWAKALITYLDKMGETPDQGA